MSFKLALDIGYLDPTSGVIARPLDAAAVQQAIVQAGGRLPDDEHPDVVKRRRLMDGFAENGRPVLGLLGPEFVILHPTGFLMIAVGGSNPPLLAFLRVMVADGCSIWRDGGGEETERILEQFAATEARWAAIHSPAE